MTQCCAAITRGELPGHKVRVVLEGGDQNLVSRPELSTSPGVRHEIDGFRAVLGENDARPVGRAHEASYLVARGLIALRGRGREPLAAAVHVRTVVRVVIGHGLDDRARLLGRRCRVEVDEPRGARAVCEQREVETD
jgi:hypothetical protein